MKRLFKDIADNTEDERITEIGETVMKQRKTAAFVTDDEPGKADRYIAKLKRQFPGILVTARGAGPVAGTVWVRVGPPVN